MRVDVENDVQPNWNEIPKDEWCESDRPIYKQLELLTNMKRLTPSKFSSSYCR